MQEKKLFGKRVKVVSLKPHDKLVQSDRYFKDVHPLSMDNYLEEVENLNFSKAVGCLEYPAQLPDALFVRIVQ